VAAVVSIATIAKTNKDDQSKMIVARIKAIHESAKKKQNEEITDKLSRVERVEFLHETNSVGNNTVKYDAPRQSKRLGVIDVSDWDKHEYSLFKKHLSLFGITRFRKTGEEEPKYLVARINKKEKEVFFEGVMETNIKPSTVAILLTTIVKFTRG
jgi:hypothetical protein